MGGGEKRWSPLGMRAPASLVCERMHRECGRLHRGPEGWLAGRTWVSAAAFGVAMAVLDSRGPTLRGAVGLVLLYLAIVLIVHTERSR